MTKYNSQSRQAVKQARPQHPAWRGIGCLMMILVPIMSWAAAVITIGFILDNELYIPYQLLGYPILPALLRKSSALVFLFTPITQYENFYGIALATFIYTLFLGGFLGVLYSLVYRYVGPPRWGPKDIPPPNIKTRRYKR